PSAPAAGVTIPSPAPPECSATALSSAAPRPAAASASAQRYRRRCGATTHVVCPPIRPSRTARTMPGFIPAEGDGYRHTFGYRDGRLGHARDRRMSVPDEAGHGVRRRAAAEEATRLVLPQPTAHPEGQRIGGVVAERGLGAD